MNYYCLGVLVIPKKSAIDYREITMSPKASKRARAKVALWKQNFLDLSSRNPQLNFNPKNAIELVHPDPSSLFRVCVVLGQTMVFPSVYKGKKRAKKSTKKSTKKTKEASETKITVNETHQAALDKKMANARLTEIFTQLKDGTLETKLKKLIQKEREAEQERGINILYLTLGVLKWVDKGDNSTKMSPLLFVPLSVSRTPKEIKILDDTLIVNPPLRQKLLKDRIKLPPFPDDFDSRSFSKFIDAVKEEVRFEKGWSVEERAFIGSFAFTKAALFEDLDDHEEMIYEHPIANAIAEEEGFVEDISNLPTQGMLRDSYSLEDSYLILDCDSSQFEAVQYAKSGSSLVIQGPPGTGKSQCIANIIAECLGVGKKVLFVAQKRAALDVVYKRLETCGIGDYCLQLHSQNSNKKDILQKLEVSMASHHKIDETHAIPFHQLEILRSRLNEYVELTNKPFGKLAFSIYDIIGHLESIDDVPLLDCEIADPNHVSEADFIQVRDLFNQLEQFRHTVEHYDENPWHHAKIASPLILSGELKGVLRKTLTSFVKHHRNIVQGLTELKLKFSETSTTLDNLGEWEYLILKCNYWMQVLRDFYRSWMHITGDYSELSEYFETESLLPFTEINSYFRSLRQMQLAYSPRLKEKENLVDMLFGKLTEYLDKMLDFQNKITVFDLKSNLNKLRNTEELLRMKKFFGDFRSKSMGLDADLLMARFTTEYTTRAKQNSESYKADKQAIFDCVRDPDPKKKPLSYLTRIKEFQDYLGKPIGMSEEAMKHRVNDIYLLYNEWEALRPEFEFLSPLFNIELLNLDYPEKVFDHNIKFAEAWLSNLPYLNDWFEVQVRAHHITDVGFGEIFKLLKNRRFEQKIRGQPVDPESPPPSIPFIDLFEKCFFSVWLKDLVESLPPIENFKLDFHEDSIGEFRRLDKEILALNQKRLQNLLYKKRSRSDLEVPEEYLTQSGFIKRELKKKRNIKSLREIFKQARLFITELKPVVMMSPLAIATYLPLEKFYRYFDVVLFDEASQVTPEDGIGAILRGKSLIVVGDSQQLPPTNFFTASVSKIPNEDNLDVEIQAMESLLDECTGLGFREKLLKFHYRSRKEGLIAFSNLKYYGNRLITFPDLSLPPGMKRLIKIRSESSSPSQPITVESLEAELDEELQSSIVSKTPGASNNTLVDDYSKITTLPAVDFRYSPKGRKLKGKNLIEAKIVAQAIRDHYVVNQKCKTNYSLGVVALNQAQQETIRTELEKLVRGDPSLEELIYGNAEESLFIKNLENVQGDERDFIFLSIGYAKDDKGTLSLNFGPLNRDGGYRRLNVAITRGRYHVKIFSSFLPSDINLDRVKAKGLADLVGYMQFARGYSLAAGKSSKTVEVVGSLLSYTVVEDVKAELESRGHVVLEKIGSSDYQVDLAVVDKKDPSRFILGLEFDSGSYETAVTARDRDRIRNAVMGNLGWSLMHVWSYHYFTNKPKVLRQIEQKIRRTRKR